VEKLQGKPAERLEFKEVRGVKGLREATLRIGDNDVRVAVANGLANAREVLDKVVAGEPYHLIEVMACPGGCIGGGGQPYPPRNMRVLDPNLLALRASALYAVDGAKELRRSHDNPAIKTVYEEFLGRPGSPKAHELLHTHYHARKPRGIMKGS
jgi:iron only hydrogenase large subunit-like protein